MKHPANLLKIFLNPKQRSAFEDFHPRAYEALLVSLSSSLNISVIIREIRGFFCIAVTLCALCGLFFVKNGASPHTLFSQNKPNHVILNGVKDLCVDALNPCHFRTNRHQRRTANDELRTGEAKNKPKTKPNKPNGTAGILPAQKPEASAPGWESDQFSINISGHHVTPVPCFCLANNKIQRPRWLIKNPACPAKLKQRRIKKQIRVYSRTFVVQPAAHKKSRGIRHAPAFGFH